MGKAREGNPLCRFLEIKDWEWLNLLRAGNGTWHDSFYLSFSPWFRMRVLGKIKGFKKEGKWKIYTAWADTKESLEQSIKFKNDNCLGPVYKGSVVATFFPEPHKLFLTEDLKYAAFISRQNYPLIKKLPDQVDSLQLPYDKEAQFPGGDKELKKFFYSVAVYSFRLMKKHQSSFYIDFLVNAAGATSGLNVHCHECSPDVLARIRSAFDERVSQMPLWIPAERNGKAVKQARAISFTGEAIQLETTQPSLR